MLLEIFTCSRISNIYINQFRLHNRHVLDNDSAEIPLAMMTYI